MSKTTPVTPPPQSSTSAGTGATHTWAELAKAVPAPTAEQLDLYAIRSPIADLVERGRHIRSEKIRTDLVRLGGIAADFYPRATPAQRRLLLGFSSALLSVTVHAGVKLGELLARRGSTVDEREASLAADTSTAEATYSEGMDERDRLATALETVVEGDDALKSRLGSARNRVIDHPSLASSLLALVKLGRELLLNKTSRVGRQLADGGLTVAELDGATALAAKVTSTGESAGGARKQGPVSQADLDLQDGICLAYLERMMKIWNGAHEKDPSIPQLLPIATRPIFAPTTKKKKDAAAAGEVPTAQVAAAGTVDPAASAEKKPA